MKPFYYIAALAAFLSPLYAEDSQRIIEISTKGIPLNGSIEFSDTQGKILGDPIPVLGQRFIWLGVPTDARSFTVISLDTRSEPVAIEDSGHTFTTINPTQPIDPKSLITGETLSRLPLIESTRPFTPLAEGESGWIFLGNLSSDTDLAEWSSLYILDAATRAKPDRTERFTYRKLLTRVDDQAQADGRIFIADFPLKVRGEDLKDPGADAPILRPGQKFEITELRRNILSVYAKFTVK